MGEPKIGDKIFLYGHMLELVDDSCSFEYNSVMGYMPIGGYYITPVESDIVGVCIPGIVVDFGFGSSLAWRAPFLDVTDRMAKDTPRPADQKTWMPTKG